MGATHVYNAAKSSFWTTHLARVGLAAKGFVYVLIGLLAFQVARGERAEATAAKGALQSLADEPFGAFLLATIGIGLFGYAFWRIVQGISDTEQDGSGAKGVAIRIGKAGSGILHGSLGFFALNLALGNGGGSGGDSTRSWTAKVLSMPLGEWWVFLIGLGVIGFGVFQVVRGWKEKFRKHLAESEMSPKQRHFAMKAGKLGHISRGFVFGIIGALLLKAGLNSDAGEARGVDGALNLLAQREFGALLLAIVAVGLAAYGLYLFVEARYRRVRM
jgi:hypothetical protein